MISELLGLADSRVAGTVGVLGCCGAGIELIADAATGALSVFTAVLDFAAGCSGTGAFATGADEVLAGLVAAAFGVEDSAVVATVVTGAAASTGVGVGVTTGAWLAAGAPTFSCRSTTARGSSAVVVGTAVA